MAATGAALFARAVNTLTSTSLSVPTTATELASTNSGYISEGGSLSPRTFVPFTLIASDRAQNKDVAINILQNLDLIEKANPGMLPQIRDVRKFALALPWGLTMIPRIWTDGESEVVLEWIKGDKHAIVSFEGAGDFGYAMRQGERFAPGTSPNDIDVAAFDDLVEYLAQI